MDPNEPFDFRGLGVAFGIVAGMAAPIILLSGAVAGPMASWLRPKWALPPRAWNGAAIAGAFFAFQVLVEMAVKAAIQFGGYASHPAAEGRTLNAISARLIVTPLFLMALIAAHSYLYEPIRFARIRRWAGRIALGALAWLPLSALTHGVHLSTIWVMREIGGVMERHELSKIDPAQDGFGGALFALAVCAMTPWMEEYFFRGLMIPWAMRAGHRPWLLLAWSLGFAFYAASGPAGFNAYAILFVALLALLLGGCQCLPKTHPKRTILAVVSTSALFAAVHSSVWPNPIPLFALALGLGYLTARTGSIVPAVVVHGLFNGVSFVTLLRACAV